MIDKAIPVVANPEALADSAERGGFAEWAMITLQTLRIELSKFYRVTVDLLSEIPGVVDEIGLRDFLTTQCSTRSSSDPPNVVCVSRASAEKRTDHSAINSTGFGRD